MSYAPYDVNAIFDETQLTLTHRILGQRAPAAESLDLLLYGIVYVL